MGERGRLPTPTKILEMRGSHRAKEREGEPPSVEGQLKCPKKLPKEARQIWKKLVEAMKMQGTFSIVDAPLYERYAWLFYEWEKAGEWLENHESVYPVTDKDGNVIDVKLFPQAKRFESLNDQLLHIERRIGISPASRANLAVKKVNPDENRGRSKVRFFKTGG